LQLARLSSFDWQIVEYDVILCFSLLIVHVKIPHKFENISSYNDGDPEGPALSLLVDQHLPDF
jgi:hypothetical protein